MSAGIITGARSDSGIALQGNAYTLWIENPTTSTIMDRVNMGVAAYTDRNGKEPNVALIPVDEFASIAIDGAFGVLFGINRMGEEIQIRPAPFRVNPGTVYVGSEVR